MKEEEAYNLIKEELNKYAIYRPMNIDIAERIMFKIHAYIREEKYHRKEMRIKRIMAYRVMAIGTGFIATYLWTGNLEAATGLSILIEIIHTGMHWIFDKWLE